MRENKFKAWDKRLKCWNYSLLEFNADGIIEQGDDFIIVEFTGLKDKNSKEIYEGDIAEGNHDIYVISFIGGEFCMKSKSRRLPMCNNDRVEIIGNIHENKELLK